MTLSAFVIGAGAFALLLVLDFLLVGFVSGREHALEQFAAYWHFLAGLATGFGIQMGLYGYAASQPCSLGTQGCGLERARRHVAAGQRIVVDAGGWRTAPRR